MTPQWPADMETMLIHRRGSATLPCIAAFVAIAVTKYLQDTDPAAKHSDRTAVPLAYVSDDVTA